MDDDAEEIIDVPEQPELKIYREKKSSESPFYIRATFFAFAIIWILLIVMNKLYTHIAAWILLIPLALFLLGFMHAEETNNCEIETDVFSTTFITVGLLFSLPLIAHTSKENPHPLLNRAIWLAMISTLFSYLHFWVGKSGRHVCKVIRSCLEMFAVSLYLYAIIIFSMLD